MILYFADRQLNILGQASTNLPDGFTIVDDTKTEDIDTGVSIFECKVSFKKGNRGDLESWADVGNYLLRSHENEKEFYQIIDVEIDTKKQNIYIYAEDDGLDLLNEVVGAYTADKSYPISHYVNMYAEGAGWTIGINEVEGLTRQLSFDSEQTTAARILKIAELFGGVEISYSFEVSGLMVTKKYINIYQERGADNGIQLRLNKEIDSITTTKTISNLATALQCTGGTPDNADNPITLKGYTYDDGDFYVEGSVLKSRKALEKWRRYLWKNDATLQAGGHIVKSFSSDTLSQAVLCEQAIEKLKSICDMEINFEADITHMPDNVRVGDRVSIIDDAANLYVSTRILILETSVCDNVKKAVLGEHVIKNSGISQKVADLAAEFAIKAAETAKALSIANIAKESAKQAQNEANTAQSEALKAILAAGTAQKTADNTNEKVEEVKANVEILEQNDTKHSEDIEEAKKTATNYIYHNTEDGLVIGDGSSGFWEGFRAQIKSTAFNVLNAAGEVCASYGAKLIELGKNATDAIISFCGGKGTIKYNPTDDFGTYDGVLELNSEKVWLRGNESASLYSTSFTPPETEGDSARGKKASVNVYPNKIDMFATSSGNLLEETPGEWVGVWESSELTLDHLELYSLAWYINLISRYDMSFEAISGDISLNAGSYAINMKSDVFISADDKETYNDGVAGWYFGKDGTAHTTHADKGSTIAFHYNNSAKSTSSIDESASGVISINGMTFGKNKVLWSGGYYMQNNQTATLSEAISAQANGIVLVFSRYTPSTSTVNDFGWSTHFVPKHIVNINAGSGQAFIMTGDSFFNCTCSKYLYIRDTSIGGNENNTATGTNNGITYANNTYVLRYVIGV